MNNKKHSHLLYYVLILILLGLTLGAGYSYSAINSDLSQTQSDLNNTQGQFNTLQASLNEAKTQLSSDDAQLTLINGQLTNAKADLNLAQSKLDVANTEYSLLISNLTSGYAFKLHDPWYGDVQAFEASVVSKYYLNTNEYATANSLISEANKQGFRCALVGITFSNGSSREIVIGFNTIDHGMIYIEPWSGTEATPLVGKHYWSQCVAPKPGYSGWQDPTTWDDTILSYDVIW